MKVFVSWSLDRSQRTAAKLADWLPYMSNEIKPFISTDLQPGQRWSFEIAQHLEECSFGILCITPENVERPWLHFEAGALAKSMNSSSVVPLLLHGTTTSSLVGPLSQFQAVNSDKVGILSLVSMINSHLSDPLPAARLENAFQVFWPLLETAFQEVSVTPPEQDTQPRSERSLLEETVDSLRYLVRADAVDERRYLAGYFRGSEILKRDNLIIKIIGELVARGIPAEEIDFVPEDRMSRSALQVKFWGQWPDDNLLDRVRSIAAEQDIVLNFDRSRTNRLDP